MGAIIAGAEDKTAKEFYGCGVNLGLAFQRQDDLLDVYGDSATFGKAIGGDILNNKKTFLMISALNVANGDDAKSIKYWIDAENFDESEKIEAVTQLYTKLGVKEMTQQAIEEYISKAVKLLHSINLPGPATQTLLNLVDTLISREK